MIIAGTVDVLETSIDPDTGRCLEDIPMWIVLKGRGDFSFVFQALEHWRKL